MRSRIAIGAAACRSSPRGGDRLLGALSGYYARLLSSIAAQPGVKHSGLISVLPLSGGASDWGFAIEGWIPPSPGLLADEETRSVGGEYFQTLGIPLLQGRLFDAHDTAANPRVAIVSARVAKKYWGEASPIGRRIRFFDTEPWTTIVGVVGDIRNHGLDVDFNPIVYVPVTQLPERTMTLVARLQPGARGAASLIGDAVRAADPEQPVFAVRMMEDWAARSVAEPRFNLALLGLFAALAVLLAGIGVYGVMAFAVARRTRELGIRLALGARPAGLLGLVMGHALSMTLIGVAAGLSAGLAASVLLETIFHGIRAVDPLVLTAVTALVVVVALVASYVPARRAMRIDPVEALRAE